MGDKSCIIFVGAPYPIRFGDQFRGRCVVFRDGTRQDDIHFPCLQRFMVDLEHPRQLERVPARSRDQVKIRLHLTQAEALDWEKHRRAIIEECRRRDLELCGLEIRVVKSDRMKSLTIQRTTRKVPPTEALRAFCEQEKVDPELAELGQTILEEP